MYVTEPPPTGTFVYSFGPKIQKLSQSGANGSAFLHNNPVTTTTWSPSRRTCQSAGIVKVMPRKERVLACPLEEAEAGAAAGNTAAAVRRARRGRRFLMVRKVRTPACGGLAIHLEHVRRGWVWGKA
ncbi:hypothetical protein GCM10010176_024000 [Nonomuraea spiralis]|nr:hypothetical protein GCM10010176_024000 [Nonomuraea spiralis]